MELQELHAKDSSKVQINTMVYPSATLISRLLFFFIYPLLKLSENRRLDNDHTYPLPQSEEVQNENLSVLIEKHKLLWALIKSNWRLLLFLLISGNFIVLLQFSGPIYMKLLIEYLSDSHRNSNYGLALAGSFMAICLFFPIISSNRSFYNELLALRIRNALFNIIYNSTLCRTDVPEGTGVNLLQVDAEKIMECFSQNGLLFNAPLQITISILLIYQQVGSAVWIGIATMASAVIINFLFTSTCKKLNEQLMRIKDKRMEQSTELLSKIKMIKAYNWEQNFFKKIQEIRRLELSKTRILNVLHSLNIFYYWTLPSITIVSVLAFYTLVMEQDLNSSKTFVTLTTLLLLQEPLLYIPRLFTSVIEMIVSVERIQSLIDSKRFTTLPCHSQTSLKDCTFSYSSKPVLSGITLEIRTNEFLGIIGPVGSGKSSLLLGLLGEIPLISGTLNVNTDIAYAPSLDSWLLNASLRDNILMGQEFKEKWYWEVVEACSLLPDIVSLPAKDFTEIGERGINLSGGQKARVCLARAVYSDKQTILLDDPLSSIDNNVAEHIFTQCFQKLLRNKTRVLVTHRHNFLSRLDRVVELKEGKIERIVTGGKGIDDKSEQNKEDPVIEDRKENKLITDEDRETGEVSKEVYLDYNRLGGSYIWVILAVLSMALWISTRILGDIFLKDWSADPSQTSYYLPIYIILKVGGCIFVFTRSLLLLAVLSIKASFNAHEKLINSLLRAPINLFYDVTPLGRILNRLSKDMYKIDEDVAFSIGGLIAQVCQCLSCVLMTTIYIPYLLVFIPLIIFPAKYIGFIYKRTSRELTRLESISRSPILNHYEQSLTGVKFIRSFNQVSNFIEKNQLLINLNTKLNFSLISCSSWMSLYLGLISSAILSLLYWYCVIFSHNLSVEIIGLCLTYMLPLPEEFSILVTDYTTLENDMVSVERVKSYISIPAEQDLETAQDFKSQQWPSIPTIKFSKVRMRYRSNTELVLKGLNFEIPAGTRAGIIGRTGSGKSSIFLSLLRIVELEAGVITIDNVNIALLGLKNLRQHIMLIPQDPLVFNGTLQENLDPFGQHDALIIKKVLDEVQLKFGLDYEIKNSGQNLSVGERQILSLSRAMICNSKILLFDETTAGIDPEMDKHIQEIIKNKFKGCTTLTIAHRLGTIMDNDLIVVLEDGKVKEIGPPKELLFKESEFKSLVKAMH